MKNSQPIPSDLDWDYTCDNFMSRRDFARYFCQGQTEGMTCGVFTGGGRCRFHEHHHDTQRRGKIGKYSGYSRAYENNRGASNEE